MQGHQQQEGSAPLVGMPQRPMGQGPGPQGAHLAQDLGTLQIEQQGVQGLQPGHPQQAQVQAGRHQAPKPGE